MKQQFWEAKAGEQPEQLKPLIGLRVYKALLSPAGTTLLLRLEKRQVLIANAIPVSGEYRGGLQLETGTQKPDAEWSGVESEMISSPHLKDLQNRIFEGIDCDVLLFSGRVGARMTLEGVAWVKFP
jgi:hypothetical protein